MFFIKKILKVFLNFLRRFFLSCSKDLQRRSKDGAKMSAKIRCPQKKSAKMASSTLRVYNIYTPSVDEAIFAAFPWGKIEHLRHLCRSLQRSAKTPQRCPKRIPFLEFYGVRGFTFSRILWGAGFWQIMSNHEKRAGCCVYFSARGTFLYF